MPEIIEYTTGNCFQIYDQSLVRRSHIDYCEFTVQNNKWFITDLSANGIFVNDVKVQPKKPTELKNSDLIQISTYLFGFRTEEVPDYANAEAIELDTVIEIDDSSTQQSPAKTEAITVANPPATASATPGEEECDLMEFELTCSICAELFINAVTLNCQHSFCELCILKWKKNSKKCPICRHDIKSQHYSLTINNMVALLSLKKSQEEKDIRKATVESRMAEFQALTAMPAAVARARTRATVARVRARTATIRQRQTGRHVPPPVNTAAGGAHGANDFIDLSYDSIRITISF